MNRRVIAVLVSLPILVTTVAAGRAMANRGGGREPIVLSEREVTVGRRGGDGSGVRLWLTWSDPRATRGEQGRQRGLRRRTYVALQLDPAIAAGSRLIAVDRDDDPEVLAKRYPSGRTHIITAATVTADGYLQRIDPSSVVVPREHAAALAADRPQRRDQAYTEPPRLTVQVRYGRRWEPWVVGVSR